MCEIVENRKEFLENLKQWDKFYMVSNGRCKSYRFISLHPKIEGVVIVINDYNALSSEVLRYEDDRAVMLSGYESYTVGNIIIDQLETQIESAKQVYIEKSDNF